MDKIVNSPINKEKHFGEQLAALEKLEGCVGQLAIDGRQDLIWEQVELRG